MIFIILLSAVYDVITYMGKKYFTHRKDMFADQT